MSAARLQPYLTRIEALCQRYSVECLYAFGSVLTDDFSDKSDIDFLVRFRRDGSIDAFHQYFEFKEGLEAVVGRKVDLVCETALRNSCLIQEIRENQQQLYVA